MNRAVRKLHQRRCALKNVRGGGFEVVSSSDPTTFGYLPEYKQTADCYDQARPGALSTQVDTGLAQVAMAGGRRVAGGRGCGCMMRGGGCGCPFAKRGGARKTRRHQLGGRFAVDPAVSVGGDGPIAAPINTAVPCDIRAGSPNPFAPNMLATDPRAPAGLYSATPNGAPVAQSGGALAGSDFPSAGYMEARIPNFDYHQTGAGLRRRRATRRLRLRGGAAAAANAYDASCYRAPGSEIPVYPAESAGFRFNPSTAAGATLPDGVTAYNEVVPYAARMAGGRRRKTRNSKKKLEGGGTKLDELKAEFEKTKTMITTFAQKDIPDKNMRIKIAMTLLQNLHKNYTELGNMYMGLKGAATKAGKTNVYRVIGEQQSGYESEHKRLYNMLAPILGAAPMTVPSSSAAAAVAPPRLVSSTGAVLIGGRSRRNRQKKRRTTRRR